MFTIVITGHRALPFAQQCVGSIQTQLPFEDIFTLYVDDASHYSHKEKKSLIQLLNTIHSDTIFLSKRHYQIGALSKAISTIKSPDTVVCLVDGDDYLLPHAIQTLGKVYSDPNVVMTYGNVLVDFKPYQNTQTSYFQDKKTVNTEYPKHVWKNRTFRKNGFRCFHLRSFRRWLWDYIDPQDFLRSSGDFFRGSGDSAFIFPMLELLADPKHVKFIDQPLYVYRLHPGNVHNHDKKSQHDDLEYIRFSKKTYPPLHRQQLQKHLTF